MNRLPQNEIFCHIIEAISTFIDTMNYQQQSMIMDMVQQILTSPASQVQPQNSCVLLLSNMLQPMYKRINIEMLLDLATRILDAGERFSYSSQRDSQLVGLLLDMF